MNGHWSRRLNVRAERLIFEDGELHGLLVFGHDDLLDEFALGVFTGRGTLREKR